MKSILLLIPASMLCAFSLMAQGVVTEGFDGNTFPPSGWRIYKPNTASGSNAWVRATSSSSPAASPHTGAGMAQFIEDGGTPQPQSVLETPVIDYSLRGSAAATVSFWIYRDASLNSVFDDGIVVWVSTVQGTQGSAGTGGTLPNATKLGKVPVGGKVAASGMSSGMSTVSSSGWYQYVYAIPLSFNQAVNYISFQIGYYVNYPGAVNMDDVEWSIPCSPPTGGTIAGPDTVCSGATNVTYAISGVVGTVNANSWTVPAGALIASGQGSTSITVNFGTTSGSVTCSPSFGPCIETPIAFPVTVRPAPTPPVISQSGDTLSVPQIYSNYQWYFEGTALPNDTNYFLIYTQTGKYAVYVTDANGCNVITADTSFVDFTGMEEKIIASGISIFPNPTEGRFNIQGSTFRNQSVSLQVYTTLGEIVYRKSSIINLQTSGSINISFLPAGLYYISLQNGDQQYIQKIIKE